jgi:hypothetical protein
MSSEVEDVLRDALTWQRQQAPALPDLLEGARRYRARRRLWMTLSVASAAAATLVAVVVPVVVLSGHARPRTPTVSPSPVAGCSPAALSAVFGRIGIGAGSVRGAITLVNDGVRPCRLDVDAIVTPLDATGSAIRTPSTLVSAAASPPLVLRGLASGPGGSFPGEVVGATIGIAGALEAPRGAVCPAGSAVEPASWRVTVEGASLTVANIAPPGSVTSTLDACQAQFSVGQQEPAAPGLRSHQSRLGTGPRGRV